METNLPTAHQLILQGLAQLRGDTPAAPVSPMALHLPPAQEVAGPTSSRLIELGLKEQATGS